MSGTRGGESQHEGEDTPEIEIVETRPAPRQQSRRDPAEHDDADDYGSRVRKRLNGLTGKYRSEEALRLAAEAKVAQLEADLLRERHARLGEREVNVTASLSTAERELRDAIEAGDHDKQAAASRKLAELGAEKGQVAQGKTTTEQQFNQAEQRAKTMPKGNALSAETQAWIDDGNDWFLSNPEMQRDAIAQHQVALGKGLKVDTPDYFKFIGDRMRKLHPDQFAEGEADAEPTRTPDRQSSRPAQVAAQTQRRVVPSQAAAATPRKVQLTSEEMSVCEALRITPQEYANQRAARAALDRS